jgi:hypothetical protein
MDRQQIINAIQSHRPALAAMGVAHLSLFGSAARDAMKPTSDVDVIVDTEDGEAFGLFKLFGIADELESVLKRKIDIVSRRGLGNAPAMSARIAPDVVHVF